MTDMIEVKTAELSGAALDYAVAVVLGAYGQETGSSVLRESKHWVIPGFEPVRWDDWTPSTDWSQGGPLIHKYQIEFSANPEDNHAMYASLSAWRRYGKSHRTRWSAGQGHLIAACRAIVASVLGETVSVPKELI
jgi:hypothetical protein